MTNASRPDPRRVFARLKRAITLLLPALIPSWNFFDWIAPSPRIEYALTASPDVPVEQWHAYRPPPARVGLLAMLAHLFWNPHRNETLFVVACTDRLVELPNDHDAEELFSRIAGELAPTRATGWLRLRLVFVHREGESLVHETRYLSEPRELAPRSGGMQT